MKNRSKSIRGKGDIQMMIDLNEGSSDEDLKDIGLDLGDGSFMESQHGDPIMALVRGKPERVASDFFGDADGFLHIGK